MFDSLPSPVVIAHRGASTHAPENTLAAFNLAVSQGAPVIELDVQLSADGEVVVFHDCSVSRTTDGSGRIRHLTLKDLKSLHAGASFGTSYPNAKIPTLNEIFNDINPDTFLNIELKNLNSPLDSLPSKVAKIVQASHGNNRVLFSSFNPVALRRIRQYLPTVPRGLLLHKPGHVDLCIFFSGLISGYQSINISFSSVTESRVNALHALGKKVLTYTLNHPLDISHALDCGVDGFFTDDPALGLRILSESGYNSN